MTMAQLISPLVAATLVAMMVSVGLAVPLSQAVAVVRRPSIVARAAFANYVLVPLVALVLLRLFHVKPHAAAGFLILAVCPGAPYGPSCTGVAKGNVPLAVGLMVLLAASSVILSPILLRLLLSKYSGGVELSIDGGRMVRTLIVTQLLPLAAGLAVRQRSPAVAAKLVKVFGGATKVLSAVVVALILATQFHTFGEIRVVGFLGMLVLFGASLSMGWLAGGPNAENRKAVAETTALRNAGVGLVIASQSFANTAAVTSLVVYAIVSIAGSFLTALVWGKRPLVLSKSARTSH